MARKENDIESIEAAKRYLRTWNTSYCGLELVTTNCNKFVLAVFNMYEYKLISANISTYCLYLPIQRLYNNSVYSIYTLTVVFGGGVGCFDGLFLHFLGYKLR